MRAELTELRRQGVDVRRALCLVPPPSLREIEAGATAKGGFKHDQIRAWGLTAPPSKGWKRGLSLAHTRRRNMMARARVRSEMIEGSPRKLLRVEAQHFVASAEWVKTPAGWRCVDATPRFGWMIGGSADHVAGYLKRKGWDYAWSDASCDPTPPSGIHLT